MGFKRLPGPLGLAFWVDTKDDPRYFAPVRAFGIRVEQAPIRDHVLFIVHGKVGPGGARSTTTGLSSGGIGFLRSLVVRPGYFPVFVSAA
ncbi:hypothetical protein M2175_001305 [Bradyrhizobium elkanii]|nr:hypothetical protein [Bradyrhizobium elkanii]MCS3966825.1 hypothetical protein [Bradyrhizobium japonicum]